MGDELEDQLFEQLKPCARKLTVEAVEALSREVATKIRAWEAADAARTAVAEPVRADAFQIPVASTVSAVVDPDELGERGPEDWSMQKRTKAGKRPLPLPEPVVGELTFPLPTRGVTANKEQRRFIAELRARRDEWFEVFPQGSTRPNSIATAIKGGSPAFHPQGSFEAVERGNRVFARYVGVAPSGRWAFDVPETDLVFSVGAGSPLRHQRVADRLIRDAGRWVRLTDIHGPASAPDTLASYIRMGQVEEFRPAGSFEAKKRGDDVFARYVGE